MVETARLLERSSGRIPKHVEHMFAWYALAAQRLEASRSEDVALRSGANEGRERAVENLTADQRAEAEALFATLRATAPSP